MSCRIVWWVYPITVWWVHPIAVWWVHPIIVWWVHPIAVWWVHPIAVWWVHPIAVWWVHPIIVWWVHHYPGSSTTPFLRLPSIFTTKGRGARTWRSSSLSCTAGRASR